MERLYRFFKEEEGISAVEYALLGSLIAVVIIGATTALGNAINTIFTAIVAVL